MRAALVRRALALVIAPVWRPRVQLVLVLAAFGMLMWWGVTGDPR